MPIAVSAREALQNRRGGTFKQVIAKPFYRRLYMGSEPAQGGSAEPEKVTMPQAYLVEQPANSTVAAHFHDTNQFQVFVHGVGAFGKQAIGGLMVHYAGAHTPYGPIEAGEHGVHYLTLRNHWDSGAKIMPANRDKLRKLPRVHRMATDITVPDASCLQSTSVTTTDLIDAQPDGLGVRRFDFGPELESRVAFDTEGAGAYAVVVGGAVEHDGAMYETHSLIHRSPHEAALQLKAGAEGASVLLLQFPPEPAAQ
ncbi:MAG: hypothetical protein ACI8W7_002967 [Gammaproteobacteria bacterium]|jgi:hypothetical protein